MRFHQRAELHLGPTVQQGNETIAASDLQLPAWKAWMNVIWLPRIIALIVGTWSIVFICYALGSFVWISYKKRREERRAARKPRLSPAIRQKEIGRSDTNASKWSGKTAVEADIERARSVKRVSAQKLQYIYEEVEYGMEERGGVRRPESIPLRDIERTDRTSVQSMDVPASIDVRTGLNEANMDEWLQIDEDYTRFWRAKQQILTSKRREEIVQSLPVARSASMEALQLIADFLIEHHSGQYRMFHQAGKVFICNRLTEESFCMTGQPDMSPIEVAARLAVEDFQVFMKNPADGHYFLAAGSSYAPSGWRLTDRMGSMLSNIYAPLTGDTTVYLDRLRTSELAERHTYFIQVAAAPLDYAKLLFIQRPEDFLGGRLSNLHPTTVVVRWESQSFRRLPRSDAVLMTVRTEFKRLVEMRSDELEELADFVQSWPASVARHRGKDIWGHIVLEYCASRLGKLSSAGYGVRSPQESMFFG